MDRLAFQDGEDSIPGTVEVHLGFTAGTAGAVPTTLTLDKYIATVVKSSTTYVVTFQDSYFMYVNGYGSVVQASYSAGGALILQPVAVSIDDSTPTVTLQAYDAAGTAVALATGDQLFFTFKLTRQSPNT